MKTLTAEEYFTKEYGAEYIQMVIDINDTVSIFGLMQEYGNYLAMSVGEKVRQDCIDNARLTMFDITPDHVAKIMIVDIEKSILETEIKLT